MKENEPEHVGAIVRRVMAELLEPEQKKPARAVGAARAGQLFETE